MMDIAAKPYSTWAVANFRVTNSQRSTVNVFTIGWPMNSIPHSPSYEP